MRTRDELIRSYDRLAEAYAKAYCDELDRKPFDRELLRRFVRSVPPDLPVCDLGCGPGHVAAHLSDLGLQVLGIDLAPAMIRIARRLYPATEYRTGDMLALDLVGESLGGIVALYSIIHLTRGQIGAAFDEMFHAIAPGGSLLVSFHHGSGSIHDERSLGQPVTFDCTLFEPEEVVAALEKSGFLIEEVCLRGPYDFEYPTTRVYVWGETPRMAA